MCSTSGEPMLARSMSPISSRFRFHRIHSIAKLAEGKTVYGLITGDEYDRHADLWPLNPEGDLRAIIMIESL